MAALAAALVCLASFVFTYASECRRCVAPPAPVTLDARIEALEQANAEAMGLGTKLAESGKVSEEALIKVSQKHQFALRVGQLGSKKASESEILMGCAETDGDKAEAAALQVQGFRLLDKAQKLLDNVLKDLKKLDATPKDSLETS